MKKKILKLISNPFDYWATNQLEALASNPVSLLIIIVIDSYYLFSVEKPNAIFYLLAAFSVIFVLSTIFLKYNFFQLKDQLKKASKKTALVAAIAFLLLGMIFLTFSFICLWYFGIKTLSAMSGLIQGLI